MTFPEIKFFNIYCLCFLKLIPQQIFLLVHSGMCLACACVQCISMILNKAQLQNTFVSFFLQFYKFLPIFFDFRSDIHVNSRSISSGFDSGISTQITSTKLKSFIQHPAERRFLVILLLYLFLSLILHDCLSLLTSQYRIQIIC